MFINPRLYVGTRGNGRRTQCCKKTHDKALSAGSQARVTDLLIGSNQIVTVPTKAAMPWSWSAPNVRSTHELRTSSAWQANTHPHKSSALTYGLFLSKWLLRIATERSHLYHCSPNRRTRERVHIINWNETV